MPARAEDFCALTVNIMPDGEMPFRSTWIELDDPSGKAVLTKQVTEATFRICDFGFGPHTLRVGINECLPVAISNLQVRFGSPISLRVFTNATAYCGSGYRTGCLAYFRVVDEDGKPVSNAAFSPPLTTKPAATDSYGRWQGLFGGNRDLRFTAPGFSPATVNIQCRQDEEVDRLVVMQRLP